MSGFIFLIFLIFGDKWRQQRHDDKVEENVKEQSNRGAPILSGMGS